MKDVQRIIDMYATGLSLLSIGNMLGVSHQYVYRRLKEAGIPRRPLRAGGPQHSQWKGGRLDAGQGYWRQWIAPDDPMVSMRNHQGYVLEHRLAMARKLGRPLLRTETVHHIDGNKSNNAPENLQLRQGRHGKHVVVVCADCGSHNIRHDKIASVDFDAQGWN